MKLRRLAVENFRSFLDREELQLPDDITILIGPNGGGKTNLLDLAFSALRQCVIRPWSHAYNAALNPQSAFEWTMNSAQGQWHIEKHSSAGDQDQLIELDLEVTPRDIETILSAKKMAIEIKDTNSADSQHFHLSGAADWQTDGLTAGDVLAYRIVNGQMQSVSSLAANTFLRYLAFNEVLCGLLQERLQSPPSMPMLSLPVNRTARDLDTIVALPAFQDHQLKGSVDTATSRSPGSLIQLAVGRLATRHRLLHEEDSGRANETLREEHSALTRTLSALGYGWELECTDPIRNHYRLHLTKQGSVFSASFASSGEKELLTYLLAIYVLNVRQALIVVDEPELHLHPQWQRMLLSLFDQLSQETGNQFLLATHSPAFISPRSVHYVSRIYSENQRSRIVRLADAAIPEPKHLFGMVNSQNNERIFFADMVILVEGLHDRVFFEAVFRHLELFKGSGKICEIVSVEGKARFTHYQKLLNACQVPHAIIADLDYVREVGSQSLRALFSTSAKDLREKVIDDPTSKDAESLVAEMDEAITTGCVDRLRPLWAYIKSRQCRLRTDLSSSEQSELNSFLEEMRATKCFILSKGALECYLPNGFQRKDLDRLITLVNSPNFWDQLDPDAQAEIKLIVSTIGCP